MSRRELVLGEHRQAIRDAVARRKGKSIALVGSVARGEDRDDSDFDFLVEFEDDACLVDVAGLRVDLRDLLGAEVDVVSESGRAGSARRAMQKEAIRL